MATLPPDVRRILEQQGLLEPEDSAASADQALQDLRDLGLLPKEEGSDFFQPVRTAFGATGGAVPKLLEPLAPEQYARARAALEKAHGVTEVSPWYEKVEAAPGLGDVAAEFIPESVRESRLGTALGPIGRLAGNILGDPTTYTPFVLGRATGAVARGVPAAQPLIRGAAEAELARRSALAAAPLAEGALGPALTQGGAQAARLAEGAEIARTVMAQGSPLQRTLFQTGSAIRGAEPYATGAAAALAYGPAAIRGAIEGWKQVGEGITEQPILDTAAEATNAALQTGLSALMAKGLISAAQATATWQRHLAEQRPAAIEGAVGAVGEDLAGRVRRLEEEGVPPGLEEPGVPGLPPEGPFAPILTPELGEPGRPRLPEEPGFAPELEREPPTLPDLGRPGLEEPIPSRLEARAEGPETVGIPREIETAPQPRITEGEIAPVLEAREPGPAPSAQRAEPTIPAREPEAPPPPRIEEPAAPEPPTPLPEAPTVTREVRARTAPEVVAEREQAAVLAEGPQAPELGPVGKVAPEGPVKPTAEGAPEKVTPEYVDGLVKAQDDILARDPEVGRLVRSVFGLGTKRRETARDIEVQGALTEILSVPEKRAALVRQIEAKKAKLAEEGTEFTAALMRKELMKAARSGEALIGRKVGQEAVERAAAEAPKPVGKAEPLPKKVTNHYDFIRAQIERQGSELQQAGIKSVGELVDQLPLAERFKPHEVQAYRDYVKARDGGKTHAEALEFVRAQQKGKWSSNQAAANTVNLILRQARELEQKRLVKAGEVVEKLPPNVEQAADLAREKQLIQSHIRSAIASGNKDELSTALGAFLAHLKRRQVFDLGRIDLKELKALAKALPDKEGARPIPASAYKNAEALVEAIARHEGVVVKDLKPKMEEKLAPVIQEARQQLAGPVRAPIKKAAGAIPGGPGGFRGMPSHIRRPGSWYEGPNGTQVTKAGDIVRVEKFDPANLEGAAEDLRALRNDPDVRVIDADLPIHLQDSLLSRAREGDLLPKFIPDPNPPRLSGDYERFVREDATQSRIEEMEAREVHGVPPSWSSPLRAAHPDVMRENWEPTAQTAIDDARGPLVALKAELKGKGLGDLDLNTPPKKLGSGTYHSVYDLPGTKLVLRVGKSPSFELSTPEQRALVQPTLAKGTLGEHAGEPIFYTVHPKGIIGYDGTGTYAISAVDDSGKLSAVLQATDPRLKVYRYDPVAALLLQGEMTGALPPGRTLQEYFDDVGTLLWKAAHADLDIAHDVMSHTAQMSTPWGMRAEQFGYFPVDRLDTMGVGYVDPNGQAWQLRAVDFGLLTPWGSKLKEHPVLSQIHESNRIALMASKPESRLTLAERTRQLLHYDEDFRDAEVIGDGLWSANHDRVATQSFVDRHGELGVGAARGLKGVVEDLVARINDQYDVPAEGKLNVEYRGLTSSPFLSGLYHEKIGARTGEPAQIYSNVAEAVAAAPSYEKAIDNMLHTVIHEVVHNKSKGHSGPFQTLEEYVKNLLEAQGQMDAYRAQMKEAFPEASYKQVQDQLVPEYLRMRREHGYRTGSWRDRAVEGVPARAAEGGAAPIADRLGGGEEAAPRDLALGVQPRGAVPGGGGRPTEELRPAAAVGRTAAEAPAEGAAAGPAVGRDPLQEVKARIAEYGARVSDEQAAKTLLHQMVEGVTKVSGKPPAHSDVHEWAWKLSGDLIGVLHPDDVALRANSLPYPRHPGEMQGPINMLHYVDLPVETKARIQIWGELTKGLWPKDVPQRWEDVSNEVHQMLSLHTPEQWAYHFRNQGGGVSAKDLLLMRQVSEELAQRVTRAEQQLYDAMAKGTSTEEIQKLEAALSRANRSAVEGGLMMAGGGTKAGRALAILRKDIRAMNPQLAFEQDLLAGLRERTQTRFRGDKNQAEKVARELFAKFMEIRDQPNGDWGEFAKAYRAMLGSKLWPDKILEFYKAGLLGWPSRLANMTSNALLRGVRLVEDAVAAGLDATQSKLTGKERELFLGEASVSTLALRRAWAEAIPEWWGEMKRNAMLRPDDFTKSLTKGSMMEDLLQHGGAIEGKKGEFLRFHLKGMGADDALAKHFVRTDNLYRQIYRRVRKGEKGFERTGGESAAQATERIFTDLRTNWQKALDGAPQYDFVKLRTFEPMMKEAEKTARRETFQEELSNLGKSMQVVLREHPFLQVFIPFFRTPWNITKETLARTPLGFAKPWTDAKRWSELTPAQQMSEMSRPLTGTALGLGALAYAMAGGATGGGPLDPDERAMLESTGWQPYSVKIGDQYISFQRLEPIAALLGVAADAAEGIRNGDFQSARTGFLRVMQSGAENVTNKTFLSGLDALSSAISHPNQFSNSFIKRMQSSIIPNSLGYVPVSGLARALDQTYRQTDPMTMSAFYAKLPFLSSTLEPQYSPSGAERKRPGSALEQIVSPFARVKLESGPARIGAEEVVRLSASPKAPRRYWVAPGGLRVDFKPDERQAMAQAMQTATRYIGERLIKDPNYLALPDNELDPKFRYGAKTKETVIKNVYSRYRDQVMQRLKPKLAQRARKTIAERG